MEPDFWIERWEKKQIGFHGNVPNRFLVQYFSKLSLVPGARIFLPLCGKTLDIHWLLSAGYKVVGAELSELAITQLFEELEIKPEITILTDLKHYQAPNIDIFVGDIFNVTPELLGQVNAIYDRAALVALPTEMRVKYTRHLIELATRAEKVLPQLLICFEYDPSIETGPPFSITEQEIKQHYE